jgi:hypothetical protein
MLKGHPTTKQRACPIRPVNENLSKSGSPTGGGGMVGPQVPQGSQPPGELAQAKQDR